MRTSLLLLILSTFSLSACQDTPACSALLTCCAGLREPSASQCREAYQVFRAEAQANLLCREASRAYRCIIDVDAGRFYLDAGLRYDVGRGDAGRDDIDAGPRYDAGRDDTDAGPEFYLDAGPRHDVGRDDYDAGPEFYPDAGPRYDVGRDDPDAGSRYDAGRDGTDAGSRYDAGRDDTDAGPS